MFPAGYVRIVPTRLRYYAVTIMWLPAAGIAAIKGVGVAAIKEVDTAAGGRGSRGRGWRVGGGGQNSTL